MKMKYQVTLAIIGAWALAIAWAATRAPATGAAGLSVYSYLNPAFLGPVLEAFEAETGIEVSAEYMTANDLLERLTSEGANPGADVVFTMEAKRLAALVEADVLIPVRSQVLSRAVPEQHRHPDGLWFGMSKWTRSIYYAKDRVDPASIKTYGDLADPRWNGRICARTSNKIYVQSLIASIIANEGEQAAQAFANGLVANFARTPIDLDIEQIKGVADGTCDLAIANSYYFARVMRNPGDLVTQPSDIKKQILEQVAIHYPDRTHVNISGFGLTRAKRNRKAAQQLMEFVVQPAAQRLYADTEGDYPIAQGLPPHALLQQLGTYNEDELPLHKLAEHYAAAERVTRESGWLWK